MSRASYDIHLNRTTIIPCENWETGTGMAGYKWIAPNERAILLYQHAFGDYTQRFVQDRSRFFPHLLQRGISVYGIDMPGSGRSPGKRGATDPFVAIRHHLTARSLLANAGVPVFLAGHSLGGLVTATSLLHTQENVAGGVLIAPAIKYDLSRKMRLIAQLGGAVVPTYKVPFRNGSVEALTRDPVEQQKLLNDPLLDAPGVTWTTARGVAILSSINWKKYPRITVPMLAVHGMDDRTTTPYGSEQFIATISSADRTVRLFDGGKHDPLDDYVGDAMRDTIINWIGNRI